MSEPTNTLTVIGCSGSGPGPTGPASCYLLQAEHQGRTWSLALDMGNGALGALQRFIDPRQLDGVLLSHLHPDHCLDLTSLTVMLRHHPGGTRADLGLSTRMPVWGPADTPDRLARAYGAEQPESVTDVYEFMALEDRFSWAVGPWTIAAFRVAHPVEAYGFRIESDEGAVLAYTGDTDTSPALAPLLERADIALMDAAFIDGRDTGRGVHLTPMRAAEAARDADVRQLVLTHIPAWNDPDQMRAAAESIWTGSPVETTSPGAQYRW